MATTKTTTTKKRRVPKHLNHTLYGYVQDANGKYARTFGKKNFKSYSAYIDVLITADREHNFSKKYQKAA